MGRSGYTATGHLIWSKCDKNSYRLIKSDLLNIFLIDAYLSHIHRFASQMYQLIYLYVRLVKHHRKKQQFIKAKSLSISPNNRQISLLGDGANLIDPTLTSKLLFLYPRGVHQQSTFRSLQHSATEKRILMEGRIYKWH